MHICMIKYQSLTAACVLCPIMRSAVLVVGFLSVQLLSAGFGAYV